MQTATLKEVTAKLGVALDDMVRYQTLGNSAIIHIDLKLPETDATEHKPPAKLERPMTPEEEFRRKYPQIKITRPELFMLVGCIDEVPPGVSDKELLIDAIESIYGEKEDENSH